MHVTGQSPKTRRLWVGTPRVIIVCLSALFHLQTLTGAQGCRLQIESQESGNFNFFITDPAIRNVFFFLGIRGQAKLQVFQKQKICLYHIFTFPIFTCVLDNSHFIQDFCCTSFMFLSTVLANLHLMLCRFNLQPTHPTGRV